MIPLLVLLLAGVASGCESICKQKYVDDVPVDISCSSNCGTSTLELRGRELVQPFNRFPYAIPEDKPTYVVKVTTNAACNICEKGKVCINNSGCGKERHSLLADKMGEWAFACHGDKENCAWVYDLAESLNQAHRRRVK